MPDPLGDFSYTWPFYAAALIGYLLGSIPFGLLLTGLAGGGDIRGIGSGNIGATNVLRTGNKFLAALTLLLDAGKGLLAAGAAGYFFGPDFAVLAGGGAVLGHLFPVWLWFKGGKGVATGIGVMLGVAWPVGLLMILTWLAVALAFRYSSLASLVSFILAPAFAWFVADLQTVEFAVFVAVFICIRHAQNVYRLVRGEEPRIGRNT
ncbi:MAG: glycerol-3-phosphate 1-O-acyltransferase PlsY [Alphaproteobacteria bacterium]|nr:glycerol-3-phosphate 1-O-acyltransferase PlsY [Alphaproteobacteria bacterium]